MGRLKELLVNSNFDLDEIAVSRAEGRRLLRQLPNTDQNHVQPLSPQKQAKPQPKR